MQPFNARISINETQPGKRLGSEAFAFVGVSLPSEKDQHDADPIRFISTFQ